jgi:hypothetical protein
MGFKCGIVGLPNVGKSTLFNALTETAAAQAANYPFCTIEPNVGEVAVPDPRLEKLAAIAKSAQIIPTRLTFVDIAGLVRGASKGEGLGNQFLANIREVDAIAHVVRCFEDSDITHVEGKIDPIADIETIETELMLADLDSLEKRVDNLSKEGQGQRQGGQGAARPGQSRPRAAARRQARPAGRTQARGGEGVPHARPPDLEAGALCLQRRGSLRRGRQHFRPRRCSSVPRRRARAVVISAKIEARSRRLSREERVDFLETSASKRPGLDRLIRAGYELLDLVTYFTVGPKEARAWTITKGTKAPAGRRRDPHRFREGLHPRRDHRLCRLHRRQRRGRRARCRQAAARRQGLRRRRRRRAAFPLRDVAYVNSMRVTGGGKATHRDDGGEPRQADRGSAPCLRRGRATMPKPRWTR